MWIAASIVFLALIFLILGHEGTLKLNRQRPKLKPGILPPVSVIVPAYRSERTIEKTLKSIKNLDYPKMETIVINDSDDRTPQICRRHGVRLIQNKKRMGKSVSLDIATKKAKNEILLFVDSDTLVEKNVLRKIVPWFYKPKVAAVMPTFAARNHKGFARLVSIDNIFIHFHLRVHSHFGSLISFRGCCFAMRKSVIKKLGGWGNFLTEDNEMGARIMQSGSIIQWEPRAVARTEEPETREDLKKQKIRWAAGSVYTFFRHKKYYMKSPQFLLYFFPYIILALATIFLILWNLYLFTATLSPAPIVFLIAELVLIAIAAYFHITVLVYYQGGFINPLLIIKYTFYYIPLLNMFYFRGSLKGLKAKKRKKNEMKLDLW